MKLSMNLSFFILGCVYLSGMNRLAAADQVDDETPGFCDLSPDALTNAFGKSIPHTCIDVPLSEDGTEVVERCFYSYVPESCSAEEITKAPLVMDVHGLRSCPLASATYTGWMQQAEKECMVLVWPTGVENRLVGGGCFSATGFLQSEDIPPTDGAEIDLATLPCCCIGNDLMPVNESIDPLFFKLAIDTVVESFGTNEDLSIDTNRVYMAGHSNGCMMSLSMAALYSDTIAAVCCHAGTVITPFPEDYSPVPIWMVHGMKDDTIRYEGSQMFDLPGLGPLGFLSVDQTISYLSEQNGCEGEGESDVVDETGVIGTIFKRGQCKENANVEVVALFEGNHFPYTAANWDPLMRPPRVDTTAMAWEFCSSYSKSDRIEATTAEDTEPIVDVEIEIDPTSSGPTSSAPTSNSFSVTLALALVLGVVTF